VTSRVFKLPCQTSRVFKLPCQTSCDQPCIQASVRPAVTSHVFKLHKCLLNELSFQIQTFKDIILQKDNKLMEVNQMHEQELFKLAAKSDASADLEQVN
jgi:hypothetical protein